MEMEKKSYLLSYLKKTNSYKKIGFFQGNPVFSLYQPPLGSLAGERSLDIRLQRRFGGHRIPAVATLAINKACQCECEHCSAVFYNHRSKPDLSTHDLMSAIRETVELGVTNVIFVGGEPLLRKDLIQLIDSIPKDKSVGTLFSNGEFLNHKKCTLMADAGLMGVFISLDSHDSKVHDSLRKRTGLFTKALQGIENLQKAGLLVAVSSYLSPQNLAEGHFESMMALGKRMGVNEVTFFDAIPSGRWLQDARCILQEDDRKKILEMVRFYRAKPEYPGISAQSTMTSPHGSAFCFAANTQFYLTAQGDMCPCDFTPLTVGRYPESSIHDLWEKMISTPPYHQRSKGCRMQDACFREKYIQPLKQQKEYPVSLLTSQLIPRM